MNELKKNLSNELVLFAANQVFAVELCCPQRIRFSLPNCVVRSESGVLCRICVVHSASGVRCRISVVCNELGVRCRIDVVRSESGVHC